MLEPLSAALLNTCGDDDDLAESAKGKIVQILLCFAQSDHKVKEAMAKRTTVVRASLPFPRFHVLLADWPCSSRSPREGLVKAASLLSPDLLAVLLKTIKNLSMLPAALSVLQNAGAIETVVDILGRSYRGKIAAVRLSPLPLSTPLHLYPHWLLLPSSLKCAQEIQNHAVNTLFNLCRLSSERQAEAASAGAIPLLQRIVRDNSPLKQFALPILCDFAHAGKGTRKLCVVSFLSLFPFF
jgi:hypothetical protein